MEIILTVGISNSGKTSWADKYIKDHPEFTNINRDDLRAEHFTESGLSQDYKFSKKNEQGVTSLQECAAENIINGGGSVIISDTNLHPQTRARWKSIASYLSVKITEKVFDVEPHICLRRNIARNYSVPPRVILSQYNSFRKYMGMRTYNPNPSLPEAVMFDIDGTIADMVGVRRPYDWDKVHLDNPIKETIELMKYYKGTGRHIILLSGRDGSCLDLTKDWLYKQGIEYDDLLMRTSGDSRYDSIVKEEIFWKNIADKFKVVVAYDDRNQVVARWRSMGLKCFQVQDGDF